MQTIQQQFVAHQARINDVTGRIKRFESELASSPEPTRQMHVQGALESAKREYLNLTGARYGE